MTIDDTFSSGSENEAPARLSAAEARIAELERQVSLLAPDRRDFLSNISVELRTPLDSIQILSRLLEANGDGNLTAKQVEWASVITRSAGDLRSLIDELLALAEKAKSD